MRGVKAKAIRKAILPKNWHPYFAMYEPISHPRKVLTLQGIGVEYRMQYVSKGYRRNYKIAKKIYKMTGVLPNANISV